MSAFRVALVAVVAAALTAACAAGQDAQTANVKTSLDGTQGSIGNIQLEGVAMHPPTGNAYESGADVPLTLYIANNGDSSDTLTDVRSAAFTGWTIQAGSATVSSSPPAASPSASIGAGAATGFSQQDIGNGQQSSPQTLLLTGLKKTALYPGEQVNITFTFAQAGQTTLTVPVEISNKPNSATVPPLPTSTA